MLIINKKYESLHGIFSEAGRTRKKAQSNDASQYMNDIRNDPEVIECTNKILALGKTLSDAQKKYISTLVVTLVEEFRQPRHLPYPFIFSGKTVGIPNEYISLIEMLSRDKSLTDFYGISDFTKTGFVVGNIKFKFVKSDIESEREAASDNKPDTKQSDTRYSIGLGFSKKDAIDKILADNPKISVNDPDAIKHLTAFVDDIYAIFTKPKTSNVSASDSGFGEDPAYVPFRFCSKPASVVKIARAYKEKIDVKNPKYGEVTATKTNFKIAGVRFEFGNGDLPLLKDDSAGLKKEYRSYKSKELTPQQLKLVGTFNKSDFISEIKNHIDDSILISVSLKDYLKDLCKTINTESKFEPTDLSTLILMGQNPKKFNYTLEKDISDDTLDEVKAASNAIAKDFGEVLGAIFMLKYLKNSTAVIYDASQSAPLLDYEIDTTDGKIGVSAKVMSGGHHPSSSIIFKELVNFANGKEPRTLAKDDSDETTDITFDELLNKNCVDVVHIEKSKAFLSLMSNTYDAPIKRQWMQLIDLYTKNTAPAKKFLKLFEVQGETFNAMLGTNISSLEERFEDKFDAICDDPKKFNELKALFNEFSTTYNCKVKVDISTPMKAKALSSVKKLGIFIYQLERYTVETINKDFGIQDTANGKIDLISAFARLAFSHKQIYLGVDVKTGKNVTLAIKFRKMNTADWRFSTAGNSTDTPFSERIALHIYR